MVERICLALAQGLNPIDGLGRPRQWRLAAAALVLPLLVACGGAGDDGPDATPRQAKAATAESLQAGTPTQPRGASASARPARSPMAQAVQLPAPTEPQEAIAGVAKRAAATDSLQPVPQRNGIGRAVPQTATSASTQALLQWQAMDGGRHAAALSLRSPRAAGMRLGLLVRALPANATLRVYAQAGTTAHEIPAADVLDSLRANRVAGDASDAASTWWGPTVLGEEATIEIELPAGVDPGTVEVALPRIAHLIVPASDAAKTTTLEQAASCHVDLGCTPDYDAESAAVLRLSFIRDSDSYVCTGTLLADRAGTRTPYVLTASHCVDNQTVASTVESNWSYRAGACNATTPDARAVGLFGGAALLHASADTNTSLIRLAAQPPAGATFAGWSAAPPAVSSEVFDIHHPGGDLQKLAAGIVKAYRQCQYRADGLYCGSGTAAQSNFLNVAFSTGSTERGSSGSALFVSEGGRRYVVGQLYGGTASCTSPQGTNIYGRFDLVYAEALHRWLDQMPRGAVYRFYNRQTRGYFYTINRDERDLVIAAYPGFDYEGPAFEADASPQASTSPVHRFYNRRTGTHFFTINPAERDHVRATNPDYVYEGEAWYANAKAQPGTAELFRLYNRTTGIHLYTVSTAERDQALRTQPEYVDEGVGYFVYGAP